MAGSKGKEQSDSSWMLNLIFPHAVSLQSYLLRWLNDMATELPASDAARAIKGAGGPLRYLVKRGDGAEFKQVR